MINSILIFTIIFASISLVIKSTSYYIHYILWSKNRDLKAPTNSYPTIMNFWIFLISVCTAILYYRH